jgi:large subunit ribosomal protein L10e
MGYQKKRSRSHRREYVRGGADPKITRFDVGNRKRIDWPITMGIMSETNVRISHHALEAIRVNINRRLVKKIGVQNFHLKIRQHPNAIYREHAMMSFAGADRLSSGMRNAFGSPIGRCTRTRAGRIIVQVGLEMKYVDEVKRSLTIASRKLCTTSKIVLLDAPEEDVPHVPVVHISRFVK